MIWNLSSHIAVVIEPSFLLMKHNVTIETGKCISASVSQDPSITLQSPEQF